VLHLVAQGPTNDESARTLFVSETTVETHLARTLASSVFVKVVEANGSYAAGSAGSNGGLIQADPGR